jgi:hypothetical protein
LRRGLDETTHRLDLAERDAAERLRRHGAAGFTALARSMKFMMIVGNDAYLLSVVPPWPQMRPAGRSG